MKFFFYKKTENERAIGLIINSKKIGNTYVNGVPILKESECKKYISIGIEIIFFRFGVEFVKKIK